MIENAGLKICRDRERDVVCMFCWEPVEQSTGYGTSHYDHPHEGYPCSFGSCKRLYKRRVDLTLSEASRWSSVLGAFRHGLLINLVSNLFIGGRTQARCWMGHIGVNGWCWRGATRALQQEAEELLLKTRKASPKKYWLSSEKGWWWRTRRAPKMRHLRSLRKRQPCPSSNRRSAGIPNTSQITSTSCMRKLTSSRWTLSLSSLFRDHCCHVFQAFVSKLAAEAFSDMA